MSEIDTYLSSETGSSRPVAAAALAIPDLAALIFSAYYSGIRVDFHPPACVIAAKSMSSCVRSCAAPTRVECPLTSSTNLAGIPIHRATRLKIGAMLPGCRGLPIGFAVHSASIVPNWPLRYSENRDFARSQ